MTALPHKEDIVQQVKTYLSSCNMPTYESWISGCVEYFIEEGYSITKIKDSAYQQWLLNDLRYICPGSLPENLADSEKTILNGPFVLQINSALDISVPAYQQYLKMKKTDIENIKATMNPEEKISNKRMLKFELTDGKQTLAAMEYETLTKLKIEEIVPGSKIMINGPVRCRQGMLLLTDSTVEFLGGEVENMLETHSLAAQLSSKLNLPLIQIDLSEITQTPTTITGVTQNETSSEQNRSRQNDDPNRHNPRSNNSNPRPGNRGSKQDPPTEMYSFGKRQLETEAAPEKKIKLDEVVFLDDVELDRFEEEDLKAIEECERLHSSANPISLPSEPFVYLKQINELSESDKRSKVFRVKAQIQNVLTKLTMTANREWNLKCTIIDGTGCMDVEFSSDILSKFLGYTPEKISELKKKLATNPDIKKEINSAYVKTAETLRTLYCIMEVTMHTLPKITRLLDFEDSHIGLLKKRLDNEDVVLKLSLR